jgi:diguanylate cyclase (GGDEF)-like protein
MSTKVKRSHVISRKLAAGCGAAAAVLGAAGLAGWVLGLDSLRTAFDRYATMKANTALGVLAAGLALFAFTALPRTSTLGLVLRRGGALLAGLIGLLTLIEHFAGVDLGIDQLLARDSWTTADLFPGRMPRAAAMGLVLYGLATIFLPRRPDWSFWVGFAFTALGFWLALFVCVAFLLAPESLYAFPWFAAVSAQTSISSLLLFMGVMLAFPDRGWARIVMTNKLGGFMARRLLPPMAVVPIGILWISQKGADLGLYPERLGQYIAAVALLIILTTIILVACGRLNVIDAHRRLVEEGRHRAHSAALRLREIAEMDPLTELSNRRRFMAVATESITSAHEQPGQLALLMVDIDHFKRINDTYGHPAGDQALRLLARTLRESTRKADCVARLGGEEFAILLPGATPTVARGIAVRICEQAAKLAVLDGSGRQFGFTVSVGLATLGDSDAGPEDLLARADAALYRAKRGGRNRVECDDETRREAA